MTNQNELLSLQTLILREDVATSEGTRAVLVQRLQEAYGNPALGPIVQALLQDQLVGTSHHGDPQQEEADVCIREKDIFPQEIRSVSRLPK